MHRLGVLCVVLVTAFTVDAVAAGAVAPERPPAGAFRMSDPDGGFTVTKKRTAVTGLHFSFENGTTPTSTCTSAQLPTGKITASIGKKLKITAAHRGGYTTYIVGRNTPKTSNGISAIPATFKLSTGGTAKGTLFLFWDWNAPKNGSAGFVVGGCAMYPNVKKR